MGQYLLGVVAALTVGAIVFAVAAMVTGSDPGLGAAEPDGRAVPLPTDRPLAEADLGAVRFDTAPRGYRMAQVDRALARAAYDIGYKDEMIGILEAEVAALRDGRGAEADALRETRDGAQRAAAAAAGLPATVPAAVVPAAAASPAAGAPAPAAPAVAGRVAEAATAETPTAEIPTAEIPTAEVPAAEIPVTETATAGAPAGAARAGAPPGTGAASSGGAAAPGGDGGPTPGAAPAGGGSAARSGGSAGPA
ncbi:hypothetical protein GCM10010124_23750 [Pilimelia terevasa]|uniref:DivIVA domain-containing protein n=1 Tax=Pilimelia terevasa TaxID=53372 RepID=A0A8J3BLI4_9ACTN|nr:DivIVA domain-containing protein [Pilimelia terevasa]GGK30266.1 hypothetical protein GCM10010124_23750 [Pilimelia terevasa]